MEIYAVSWLRIFVYAEVEMDYIALYRKWRPQDFSALVGQEHIKTALTNALVQNRIAHAYLFSGPRGTGKTSTARILAKAVNCEKGPTAEPCNVCENCVRINNGTSMDVIEIDAASSGNVDQIRNLREHVRSLPVEGRKRIYIIDEVHMMSTDAFNALLKTLEEPPSHVLFILATTEPHKLPATILSRCQRYDFRRLSMAEMTDRLKEVVESGGLNVTDGAISLIASQSDGGMRDALSLLDQCSVMAEGEITEDTIRALLGIAGRDMLRGLISAIAVQDKGKALKALDGLLLAGRDVKQLISEMALYLRAVILCKVSTDFTEIYLTDSKENLEKMAECFSMQQIVEMTGLLHASSLELRSYVQPRIIMEMCLMQLCSVTEELEKRDLLRRVEDLEKIVAGGKVAVPVQVPVFEKPQLVREEKHKAEIKIPKEIDKQKPTEPESVIETPAVEKSPEPDSKPQAELPEDGQLWEKVLEKVLAQNKKSLYACAKSGKLKSMENGEAVVEFDKTFASGRMQEDDYRTTVESIMSDLIGASVKVRCVAVNAKEKPLKKVKEKKAEPLPEAVAAALEVFGGQVVKIKGKE